MSKHSHHALTLLAISALGVSTAVSIAQTNGPTEPAAPAIATDDTPQALPTHSRGGGFLNGRRGGRRNAMMQFFGEVDADNDGSVTQTEVDQFLANQLTQGDTDGDGSVNLDEFQVIYLERTRPAMVDAFQGLDDDGDGQITAAELSDRFGSVVQRMDRNGDDALSADDRGRRGERRGRDRDRGER